MSLASIQPDDPKKEPSNIVLKLHPQVSYFQSPLLEIAPDVYKQLTKQSTQNQTQASSLLGQSTNYAVSITMQNEASDRFLKQYQPLINPFLLPIATNTADLKQTSPDPNTEEYKEEDEAFDDLDVAVKDEPKRRLGKYYRSCNFKNNRRKFSAMDDNYMLLGLRQYGYKDVERIRENWLLNKNTNEIKHRYKNLIAARAQKNMIKKWKESHQKQLTATEERLLARAVKWFGPNTTMRWPLISKCFLPNRSPRLL